MVMMHEDSSAIRRVIDAGGGCVVQRSPTRSLKRSPGIDTQRPPGTAKTSLKRYCRMEPADSKQFVPAAELARQIRARCHVH